jgi:SynChlorMet cassette radical SAM/SPASM protein ScmF
MTKLFSNGAYKLVHIDPTSGYCLLYNRRKRKFAILDTVAAIVWEAFRKQINPFQAIQRLMPESHSRADRIAEYIEDTISVMNRRGLLVSAEEKKNITKRCPNLDAASYPLEQIYFYSTTRCNANCYHCYQRTTKVESKIQAVQANEVGKEAFLNFVEKAVPLGLRVVKLTGGEPFLRSDLPEIIQGLRNLGIAVTIETNGFFIDKEIADLLSDNEVDVAISLDGGCSRSHDTLRGLPGSFAKVVQAIKMLSERGCQMKVVMAVSKLNLNEIEKVLSVITSNGCYHLKINPVNIFGASRVRVAEGVRLTPKEVMTLYERRAELEETYNAFISLEGPLAFATIYEIAEGHIGLCPFTRILGILSDGSISYCGVGNCHEELILGNISQNLNLQEFWNNSPALNETRRILLKRLKGVCGTCIFENYCKGSCRALAYESGGSFSSPDPWCQTAFEEGFFPEYYKVN